jgi:taurine dioxygenase
MIAEMLTGNRLPQGRRAALHRLQEEIEAQRYQRIGLAPMGPTIGAEVEGVSLCEDLDDATFAEVERAFLYYKVLFFRDQPMSDERHLAFARRFGELEQHPFLPSGSDDQIVRFEKNKETVGVENLWHSDVSWREKPALGSFLRAREVPRVGGDTLFADMVAAYECLPGNVKEALEGMTAIHDFAHSFGLAMTPDDLEKYRKEFSPVEHPVVRVHPVTGKKLLYVNAIFTSHVVGVEREESDRILDALFAQAAIPEYQCRFRWQPDSVALWDNRAVQHYASSDYWPQRRVMERVSIIGDRPR